MGFNLTLQEDYWSYKSKENKYCINSELLRLCIGPGSLQDSFIGFNKDKCTGYALLAYFCSVALGFRRLPFCEDRIYFANQNKIEYPDIVRNLDECEIQKIVDELKKIYSHTQDKLKAAKLTTVKLRRHIAIEKKADDPYCKTDDSYAERIIQLKKSAEAIGQKYIEFEMDVLNSYGEEGYDYLADVTIEHEFMAEDVLYCSNLVGDQNGSPLMEAAEWVVVNRSSTGVVKFPASSIKYDKKNITDKSKMSKAGHREQLSKHMPIIYRTFDKPTFNGARFGKKMRIRKKIARWIVGK